MEKPILILDLDETLVKTYTSDYPFIQLYEKYKYYRGKFFLNSVWYYVIFRPGVENFLKSCKESYRIFLYSNGIEHYVTNVLKLFPENTFEKVISRKKLNDNIIKDPTKFGVSLDNFLIVDDRIDVWEEKYYHRLIQIPVYKTYENTNKVLLMTFRQIKEILNN